MYFISKLPCFSKILERAMNNRLTDFLEQNNVLYNKQFGFTKNHSTTFAIVEVVDKISEAIDCRQVTVGSFWTYPRRLTRFDMRYFGLSWTITALKDLLWIGLNPILLTEPNKSALRILDQTWL